jgi:hypothetical protein
MQAGHGRFRAQAKATIENSNSAHRFLFRFQIEEPAIERLFQCVATWLGHGQADDGRWTQAHEHLGKGHAVFCGEFAELLAVEHFEFVAAALRGEQFVELTKGGSAVEGVLPGVEPEMNLPFC